MASDVVELVKAAQAGDRAAFDALRTNKAALDARRVELARGDALEFVRGYSISAGLFDVIFLDPPFDADYCDRIVPSLPPLMARDARVYCEAGEALEWGGEWEVVKQGRAGQVSYQLVRRAEGP